MIKPLFYWCMLLFLLAGPARAQEEIIEPPSKDIVSFPFIMLTGGIIIIHGLFENEKDTLNFVLDTGSSGISLDSAVVENFSLIPEKSGKTIRGIGGTKEVLMLSNKRLKIASVKLDSLNFHIADYSTLSAIYGMPIHGIIGHSLFSRYIVKINYDRHEITLASQGPIKYPKKGTLIKLKFGNRKIPSQEMEVRDNTSIKTNFLYDIGAGLCVIFSEDFIEESKVLKKNKKLRSKDGEGLGGKVELKTTTVKEMKIGPYKFRKVPAYIYEDEFDITPYPAFGGILGNDLLRRFNAIINYSEQEVHIRPNTHFKDPFDYSYSGLELYLLKGKIYVGSIVPGSLPDIAGLQVGDEVIAINGDLNQDLNKYKQILMQVGSQVRFIIRRETELLEVRFKIQSILN